MKTINITFTESEDLREAKNCIYSLNFPDYLAGGFFDGLDVSNNDILFLFHEEDLPIDLKDKKMVKLLFELKQSWEKAGFVIVEDRMSEYGEFPRIKYPTHFFRLRKNNVICKCAHCTYSKYDRCFNTDILEEFENISFIDYVTIVSSLTNCLKFNENPHSHDVE